VGARGSARRALAILVDPELSRACALLHLAGGDGSYGHFAVTRVSEDQSADRAALRARVRQLWFGAAPAR
jgi:hypothetical protein